jgi:RimJ/RimL family protein N-acetyltransferase
MFARTPRLTLRPPWPEDAHTLSLAIGHESIATKLSRLPWPYTRAHAEEWLARPRSATDASCVILSHELEYPELIGVMSIEQSDTGAELGYWLTPAAWGRGYATEAGRAMLGMARHALGLKRLQSGYFADNPASGHVLRKLGFRETGEELRECLARGHPVPCITMELALEAREVGDFRLAA